MQKQDLADFCKSLVAYFERKPIQVGTMDQWFQELGNLPADPLPWIAAKIKALDAFPRNLPGAVKHYWGEWLEANPDRREREKELGCTGCLHGYIQVSRFEKSLGRYYNTTFRCARCRPRYPQSMTMATVELLASQGYCKPVGYFHDCWHFADMLPDPEPETQPATPAPRQDLNTMVGAIADAKELPF